ncbi:MAG: tyrosine-type recombinase/integrase [Ignavibacteriaceae bacterium]
MNELQLLIDDFLSHCKYEKNLSPLSLKAYQIDLEQFQKFITKFPSIEKIGDLDKTVIRDYIKEIFQGNKPKTIKRKLATLKVFMNHLEYEDIIIINPFRKIRLNIKEGKQLPKIIDLKNIKKLFSYLYAVKETLAEQKSNSYNILIRDIAVLELLFATGMRVSELSHLKLAQINLTKGATLVKGKGNRERIIPIPHKDILELLKIYFELYKEEITKSEYFFVNRLKKRLTEQSIRRLINKYASISHLGKHITPHMFRHSVATYLLENGADIRYIQNILGHSSISTTQIYAQVNEAPKRRVLMLKHPRRKFNLK